MVPFGLFYLLGIAFSESFILCGWILSSCSGLAPAYKCQEQWPAPALCCCQAPSSEFSVGHGKKSWDSYEAGTTMSVQQEAVCLGSL